MAGDDAAHTATARDGDTEDMLPARGTQSPPTIHQVNRRPLGIGPVPLLGSVLLLVLVLAIILLALGSWAVGIVLFACSMVCLALLLVAVESEPEDAAAQLAITAAEHARSQTRRLGVTARAWSRASLVVVRMGQRRYHLRWRLRRQLTPIGEAAYRGDLGQVERLKAQARRVEQALHEAERESSEAVRSARAEIEHERNATQATQTLLAQEPARHSPD